MAKDFSSLYKNICTEEQLYRISMYPPLRKKIEIMSKHKILYKSISFIFQNVGTGNVPPNFFEPDSAQSAQSMQEGEK